MREIAYGTSLTVIGSSMIPLIRNGIKMGVSAMGAELAEAFGWTDEMNQELGDYGLTYAEKSFWDVISQNLSLTVSGDILDTVLISKMSGRPYQDVAMNPFQSAYSQMFRAVDSLFFTDWNRGSDIDRWRKINAMLRVAGGVSGIPTYPINQWNAFLSQIRANEDRRMQNMGYIAR